jgi:hypothetical protein
MPAKKILLLAGDFVEDYEIMVPLLRIESHFCLRQLVKLWK